MTISYIVTAFFGYYIGTDFVNYNKTCKNHQETLSKLSTLERKLTAIETNLHETKL